MTVVINILVVCIIVAWFARFLQASGVNIVKNPAGAMGMKNGKATEQSHAEVREAAGSAPGEKPVEEHQPGVQEAAGSTSKKEPIQAESVTEDQKLSTQEETVGAEEKTDSKTEANHDLKQEIEPKSKQGTISASQQGVPRKEQASVKQRLSTFWRNFVCAESAPSGEATEKITFVKIVAIAFISRMLIVLVGWLIMNMVSGGTVPYHDAIGLWDRQDAPHYIELAQNGYAAHEENGQHLFLVFFPLYPWALRVFHALIRGLTHDDWVVSAMILSWIFFAAGSCYFYALTRFEYGKKTAERALTLLYVFPFSFFFDGPMTESLFFFVTAAGFWYIRKHKWAPAAVFGFLATLTRVQGILLFGVAFVEFFIYYKPFKMAREGNGSKFGELFLTKGILLFLIPVGELIYLALNKYVEGNAFAFRQYQSEHWMHSVTPFSSGVREVFFYAFDQGTSGMQRGYVWIPDAVLLVLSLVLLIYGLKRHALAWTAYLFVYTFVCYSVTWLISGGRYMLCALPIYMIGGKFLSRHDNVYRVIAALSAVLMGLYFMGFVQWQVY